MVTPSIVFWFNLFKLLLMSHYSYPPPITLCTSPRKDVSVRKLCLSAAEQLPGSDLLTPARPQKYHRNSSHTAPIEYSGVGAPRECLCWWNRNRGGSWMCSVRGRKPGWCTSPSFVLLSVRLQFICLPTTYRRKLNNL